VPGVVVEMIDRTVAEEEEGDTKAFTVDIATETKRTNRRERAMLGIRW
jgi:hypothetical protein